MPAEIYQHTEVEFDSDPRPIYYYYYYYCYCYYCHYFCHYIRFRGLRSDSGFTGLVVCRRATRFSVNSSIQSTLRGLCWQQLQCHSSLERDLKQGNDGNHNCMVSTFKRLVPRASFVVSLGFPLWFEFTMEELVEVWSLCFCWIRFHQTFWNKTNEFWILFCRVISDPRPRGGNPNPRL